MDDDRRASLIYTVAEIGDHVEEFKQALIPFASVRTEAGRGMTQGFVRSKREQIVEDCKHLIEILRELEEGTKPTAEELVGQPVEEVDVAADTNAAIMNAISAQSRAGWAKFDDLVSAGEELRPVTPERLAAFHASLQQQGFQVAPVAPPVELPNLDYDAAEYSDLQTEISDGFMGETGDLIREHAKAVIALRRLTAGAPAQAAPAGDNITRIDITEFREQGFLQEANRQFFHPLGLALETVIDGGVERLGGVWDYRADPEGMVFGPGMIEEAKATRVAAERNRHTEARLAMFRAIVQPIIPPPTECDAAKYVHVGPWERVPNSDQASRCAHCGHVSGK